MTEDEAKKKWCPKARENSRRVFSDSCIGSGCMAWRWSKIESSSEVLISKKDGFCGLAGKP